MGQARKRGSREDRIEQALQRRAEEERAREMIREAERRQYAEWYCGLSEQHRAEEDARLARKKQRMSQAQLLTILAAAVGGRYL